MGQEHKKNMTQLWMVPYADLMSIMVIFFLALYGFAVNAKTSDLEKALAVMRKDLGDNKAEKTLEELEMAKKVEKDLEKQIEDGTLGVEVDRQFIKLTFSSPILFASGSADLKKEASAILAPVAETVKKMGNAVIVDGHTDAARIIGGKFASNRELSLMRAFSVIDYFVKSGLDPQKINAFGYGEYRPAADNSTAEGRALNRRIEIKVLRNKEG